MKSSETSLVETIIKALKDLVDTLPDDQKFVPDLNTVLFGTGSTIDSLTLVSFIVDLESLLSEKYSQSISLTDDRAMTREKSPFSSVNDLVEYIEEIIDPTLLKKNVD
jgi:acyl carrier protein